MTRDEIAVCLLAGLLANLGELRREGFKDSDLEEFAAIRADKLLYVLAKSAPVSKNDPRDDLLRRAGLALGLEPGSERDAFVQRLYEDMHAYTSQTPEPAQTRTEWDQLNDIKNAALHVKATRNGYQDIEFTNALEALCKALEPRT